MIKKYLSNKKTKLYFYRLLHPKRRCIDHINRNRFDNRKINLRETNHIENSLNHRLSKNNTSRQNSISYCKYFKKYVFRWYENKKQKSKYFKTKQEAIDFKLAHDKNTGNKNDYDPLNL